MWGWETTCLVVCCPDSTRANWLALCYPAVLTPPCMPNSFCRCQRLLFFLVYIMRHPPELLEFPPRITSTFLISSEWHVTVKMRQCDERRLTMLPLFWLGQQHDTNLVVLNLLSLSPALLRPVNFVKNTFYISLYKLTSLLRSFV